MTEIRKAQDGSRVGNRARKACEVCGKRYPHTCPTPASHPAQSAEYRDGLAHATLVDLKPFEHSTVRTPEGRFYVVFVDAENYHVEAEWLDGSDVRGSMRHSYDGVDEILATFLSFRPAEVAR
jgi:hypothetical protein